MTIGRGHVQCRFASHGDASAGDEPSGVPLETQPRTSLGCVDIHCYRNQTTLLERINTAVFQSLRALEPERRARKVRERSEGSSVFRENNCLNTGQSWQVFVGGGE